MKIGTRKLFNPIKTKETGIVTHWSSEEEMNKSRKRYDCWQHQNKNWKKKYGFNISLKEYDEFSKNHSLIKKIYPILDWFLEYDSMKTYSGEDLEIFGKNYQAIMDALPIRQFINNLKRVNNNLKHCS